MSKSERLTAAQSEVPEYGECKDCDAWKHVGAYSGMCIRHSPAYSKGQTAQWPVTHDDNGCFDFLAAGRRTLEDGK